MAVIITNMDMPENCIECPLRVQAFCKVDGHHEPHRSKERCPLKSTDEMMEKIRGLETILQEEIDDENPYISGGVEYVPLNEVMEIINEYI